MAVLISQSLRTNVVLCFQNRVYGATFCVARFFESGGVHPTGENRYLRSYGLEPNGRRLSSSFNAVTFSPKCGSSMLIRYMAEETHAPAKI